MGKGRLEAFSDGVLAIILTIMVLELKVPHGPTFAALFQIWPVFLSYIISFVYIGIYWNNHHHMLSMVKRVNGGILWANLHLLFWLSLFPFTTDWVADNHFASVPMAVYGFVLLMAGLTYWLLQGTIIRDQGEGSLLRLAVGGDFKGKLSPLLYFTAIPLAFVHPALAGALYIFVALMWLVPDPRIEKRLAGRES
ncbi:TMEM175 family protein [soil metagenome]